MVMCADGAAEGTSSLNRKTPSRAPSDSTGPRFPTRGRPTPTVYDVASAANVSHMTVSRAMNGQRGLSEATRERVLDVARVLGYVRNPAARALAGALPPRLGVILASSDPDASARVLRGFGGAAHLAGRTIAARSHEGDGDGVLARIAREFGDGGFSGLCGMAAG